MLNHTVTGKTIKAVSSSSTSTGLSTTTGGGGSGGGVVGGTPLSSSSSSSKQRRNPFAHLYRDGAGVGTSNIFTNPLLSSLNNNNTNNNNKPATTGTLVLSLVLQILMLVYEIVLWCSRKAGNGFVLLLEIGTTTVRNRRSSNGGAGAGGTTTSSAGSSTSSSFSQKRIRSLTTHSVTRIGFVLLLSITVLSSMMSFQRDGKVLTRVSLADTIVNNNNNNNNNTTGTGTDNNPSMMINNQQKEQHRQQLQQVELQQQQREKQGNRIELQQQSQIDKLLRYLPDVQYEYDGDYVLFDTRTKYKFEPLAPTYRVIDDTARPEEDPFIMNIIKQINDYIITDPKYSREIQSVLSNGEFVSCQFIMFRFNPENTTPNPDDNTTDPEESELLAQELEKVKICAESLHYSFNKTATTSSSSDVTLRPKIVPVETVGKILTEKPKILVKNKEKKVTSKSKYQQQQQLLFIYYNPLQRERYLCDHKIGPKQILILAAECPYPARLFLATPGRGIPLSISDTDRFRTIQNLPYNKQRGLNPLFATIDPSIELRYSGTNENILTNDYDQCDVPCTSYGEPGKNDTVRFNSTLRFVENLVDQSIQTKWTIQQGFKYATQLIMDPNNWKRNVYYSTTNYNSEIIAPHFSWSEYDILMTKQQQQQTKTFLRHMIRNRQRQRRLTADSSVAAQKQNSLSQFASSITISSETEQQQQQQQQQQLQQQQYPRRKLQEEDEEEEGNYGASKIPNYSDRIKGAVFNADDCVSTNNRELIARSLRNSKVFRVDSVGACLHNAEVPPGVVNATNKVEVLSKYMFSLAFENQNTEDYVTGELWQALEAGTIPIYYGAPNVEAHAPENSYINVFDYYDPSPSDPVEKHNTLYLAEYLNKVANDPSLYESYHYWRTVPLSDEFHNKYDFTKTHSTCRACRWAFAKQYGYSWVHSTQSLRHTLNIGVPRYACIRNHVLYQPFIERWRVSDETTLSQRTTSIVPLSKFGSIQATCDIDGIPKTVVINDEIQRTIVDKDGVIDMYINVMDSHSDRTNYRSKDTYVLHLQTLLAASTLQTIPTGPLFFKEIDKGRFIVQNSHSRLTILSWPFLSRTRIRVSKKGNIEIRIPDLMASATGSSSAHSTLSLEDGLPLRLRFISEDIDTFHGANWYDNYFGTYMTKDFYHAIEPYVYVPHPAETDEDENFEEGR